MSDFKDKIVIVTGGARGIGGGISRAFAEEGASVLCADLDEDSGAQLVEEAASMEGTVRFMRADVAHSSECRGVVETAVSEWGRGGCPLQQRRHPTCEQLPTRTRVSGGDVGSHH